MLFLSAFREWRFCVCVFFFLKKKKSSSFVIVNHRKRGAKKKKKKGMPRSNLTERFSIKSVPFLVDWMKAVTKHELLTKVHPPPDVFPFKTNKSRKISSLEFLRYWKKKRQFFKRGEKEVLRETQRLALKEREY